MNTQDIEDRLRSVELKVTPQRIALLKALHGSNHPTAEQLVEIVKQDYQSISPSTVYHILDAFVDRGLINKVFTHGDVMRYDVILRAHHHLYEENTNRMEDYFDDELFELIEKHLLKKKIPGFELSSMKIKLVGKFND